MSYGFRSESSSGIVQIDDSFQNFVLVQEGVASGNFFNISLVDQPQNIMAMVRLSAGQEFFTKSNANPSFDYRIYARQSLNRQLSGHGIIVNDASGNRVFDSGVKKLNVSAVHYLNLAGLTSQVTYPSVGFRPYIGIGCLETTGVIGQPMVQGILNALHFRQNADNSVTFFQKGFAGAPPQLVGSFWGGGTKSIIIGD
jgi:hypothetical protein